MLRSLLFFSRSCVAGKNGYLDLSRCWMRVKERVSLVWSRCRGFKARRASAGVTPSRRNLAG